MLTEEPVDDNVLLHAIRQRMLDEIRAKREAAIINNNVYGGSSSTPSMAGIQAGLHDAAPTGGDDRDYFVDIMREALDPENPQLGWRKNVHRYSKPKGKSEDPKKKAKAK